MPGPDPRAAVRNAALERRLSSHDSELGWKMGESLTTALRLYHEEVVGPLEKRVVALETPWYLRLWNYVRRRKA